MDRNWVNPQETGQLESSPSPLTRIKLALTQFAIFRQAKIDKSALELYSARLAQEPAEDVLAAIEKMQELPRQAGEPSLPEIGVFLAMTRTATVARENRVIAGGGEELVRRRCTNCGRDYSDYVGKGAAPLGICRAKVTGEHGEELPCNGQLVELWRQVA